MSEFLTACGECKIYHSLTLELVVGDLLRSCSFWNLWIKVSCVFFGTFFLACSLERIIGKGEGCEELGTESYGRIWIQCWQLREKNGLVLLL